MGKFAIFIVQIPKKSLFPTLMGLDICFSCLKYKCRNSKTSSQLQELKLSRNENKNYWSSTASKKKEEKPLAISSGK